MARRDAILCKDGGIEMNTASQNLMGHPYWGLMRLQKGGNPFLRKIAMASQQVQIQFWTVILFGFSRISRSSPHCFGAVVRLADNERTRAEADAVLQPELGNAPFVESLRGIPHADSFQRFVESLARAKLRIPRLGHGEFPRSLEVGEDLLCALACCQVIEEAAEQMVHDMMEVAAQWMVMTGLQSKDVWWPFVAEHILTEGSMSPDQHTAIVQRMLEPHPEFTTDPRFEVEQMRYAELARRHLDKAMKKLPKL